MTQRKFIASAIFSLVAVSCVLTSPALAKERRKHHTVRSLAVAPPARPIWTGADPTKGPGVALIRQMQREGRCIMDEGYGRYSACSND